MTQSTSHRRPSLPPVIFSVCVAVLILTLFAAAALIANQRAAVRGIPSDLPEPVAQSDVSPFCINAPLTAYEGQELDWALDLIAEAGFVWVRQTFAWARIEPAAEVYEWEPWDRAVEAAGARGLRLIAVLDTAPQWAGTPPPPTEFADFASALATRYGGQIDHYQIWHNPNLADGWGEPLTNEVQVLQAWLI